VRVRGYLGGSNHLTETLHLVGPKEMRALPVLIKRSLHILGAKLSKLGKHSLGDFMALVVS
jgi:hypothetical protein